MNHKLRLYMMINGGEVSITGLTGLAVFALVVAAPLTFLMIGIVLGRNDREF